MALIRSIPLAQYHIQLDKLIWPNSNGHCTVKETSKFIYTYEGIQFDKVDGIGFGKPHIHKKIKFLYGNAPIIEYYRHVPLLLTTNMVLAFSVFNVYILKVLYMSFETDLGQRNFGLLFLDNEKYLFSINH